jgi:hypothetical protein
MVGEHLGEYLETALDLLAVEAPLFATEPGGSDLVAHGDRSD